MMLWVLFFNFFGFVWVQEMELSKQTLDGLALVTKENFDDAAFKALLATAFRVAAGDAKQGAEEKLACKFCAQPLID